MTNDDKAFLDKMTLYLATLFARKMTRIVYGAPDTSKKTFFYSNIDPLKAEFYEPDPAYYIHKVDINDTVFLQKLFELYPVFEHSVGLVWTDKFLSALRKHTGNLAATKLTYIGQGASSLDQGLVLMTDQGSTVCGVMLSEFQANRYRDIYDSGFQAGTAFEVQDILDTVRESDGTIIPLSVNTEDSSYKIAFDKEKHCVSIKEYVKKAKLKEGSYTLNLIARPEGQAIVGIVCYADPNVVVKSIQPAAVWFKQKPLQHTEENNHD